MVAMQQRAYSVFKGALIGGGVCLVWLTWSFSKKRISSTHSTNSAVKHFLANTVLRSVGRIRRRKLERDTKNVEKVQEKFLLDLLKKHKSTVYGQDHDFGSIHSRTDFINKHPLTRYDDYFAYVSRVYGGEDNVMTVLKPKILAVTSGTSGTRSMLPSVKENSSLFCMNGILVLYDVISQRFGVLQNLQKTLKLEYMPKFKESPANIPVGPNFSNPKETKGLRFLFSTPPEAYDITTEREAVYIHLLFALSDRNLGMIEANFVHGVYVAFQHLKEYWQQLVCDIGRGKIDDSLNIEPSTKEKLECQLLPNPERAQELETEFSKGFHGIAKRIWPEINFVLSVDTGSADLYGKLLRSEECHNVPFYSPLYIASEGLMAVNLNPNKEEREYTMLPSNMFFEFIPIDHTEEQQPKTVLLHEVKQDEVYELVITNVSGLYRYRLGDVVKVTSFHNQSPNIQFLYRQGQFLNVQGEKTSEKLFYDSLTKASKRWEGLEVKDYCCVESALASPYIDRGKGPTPFYVIFMETNGPKVTEEQQRELDTEIQDTNYVYRSFRTKGSIAPLQVYTVPQGTFQQLKRYFMENTSVSSNQYKVPRVLKNVDAVKFMCDCYNKEQE